MLSFFEYPSRNLNLKIVVISYFLATPNLVQGQNKEVPSEEINYNLSSYGRHPTFSQY